MAQRLTKILFKGHTRKYCIRGPQIAPVDRTHSVEGGGGGENVTPGFSHGVLLVLITVQERFPMQPLLTLTPVLSLVSSLHIPQSSTHFEQINQTANKAKTKQNCSEFRLKQ